MPAGVTTLGTYAGHLWLVTGSDGSPLASVEAPETPSLAKVAGRIVTSRGQSRHGGADDNSPDGRWTAFIRNHNLFVRSAADGSETQLTRDGTDHRRYGGPFLWSPDSKRLIATHTPQVAPRRIHIVESSPPDQLQPKLRTLNYNKPGDPIQQTKPRLFDIQNGRQIELDDALFNNPWEIRDYAWAADSSEFSFVYNQRGHQIMRIVGIRGDTGEVRVIHEERSSTFIDYSQKYYFHRIGRERECIWTSERDGVTDIHGVIIRPRDFDPAAKYPVVEDIYAGPHDHFVPKSHLLGETG